MSNLSLENELFDHGVSLAGLAAAMPVIGTGGPAAATATVRGSVLRAAAVANAAAAPTKAEFDALLVSLRAAGILAP